MESKALACGLGTSKGNGFTSGLIAKLPRVLNSHAHTHAQQQHFTCDLWIIFGLCLPQVMVHNRPDLFQHIWRASDEVYLLLESLLQLYFLQKHSQWPIGHAVVWNYTRGKKPESRRKTVNQLFQWTTILSVMLGNTFHVNSSLQIDADLG